MLAYQDVVLINLQKNCRQQGQNNKQHLQFMFAKIFCKSVSCTTGAVVVLGAELELLLAVVVFGAVVEGGAEDAAEDWVSDLVALLIGIQVFKKLLKNIHNKRLPLLKEWQSS